jgi:hypothetical protein
MATEGLGAGLRMCLDKMGEKDLVVSPTNSFSFRFTILPTRGNPVSIRVEREGTVLKLSAKRLDGRAVYKIGDLIEARERALSDEESKEIFSSAGKLGFFEIPAKEREAPEISDGERWLLEGSQRGRFHRVERESANVDAESRGLKEFVKFCALPVKHAHLSAPPSSFKNKE